MAPTGEVVLQAPAPRHQQASTRPHRQAAQQRTPVAWLSGAVLLAFAVELAAILVATGGHFTYTLDDPYIHLALADHIRHGHYGINPGEASSPSSSPLWPFLLAATAGLPFQAWMPLIWNLFATLGSVLVLHDVFVRHLSGRKPVAATVVAAVGLNLVGVAFTGMEHSLQVLLALLVGRGVVRLVRDDVVDRLLLVAVVVGPLVRYENAALSVAAAVLLLLRGRVRVATLTTLAWLLPLVGFSVFLMSLGLDPLPSSVLAKSALAGSASPAVTLGWHVVAAFVLHPVFLLAFGAFVLDAVVMRRWTLLHSFGAFLLAAHAVAGNFEPLCRYELYVLAAILPAFTDLAGRWWCGPRRQVVAGRCVVTVVVISTAPLALWAVRTPAASADIASQQAQTARFVAEYWQRPIAVNDLGLVAYRGGQPVLDLWGLASQEARKDRLAGGTWLGPLVAERGVQLAAVYPEWFPGQIPGSWVEVATLTGTRRVASAERTVSFYATTPGGVPIVCDAVERFAADAGGMRVGQVCGGRD